jgi:hypothetical protein
MALIADSANSTAAWFTLAGVLGGVLLTSVVALTTAILNHRWQTRAAQRQLLHQHARQLRQERRETYARYWLAWNRLTHQLRMLRREVESQVRGFGADVLEEIRDDTDLLRDDADIVEQSRIAELEWREAADALLLIAGQAVAEAALAHIQATERRIEAVRRKGEWPGQGDVYQRLTERLNDAMRGELLAPSEP